MQRIPVVSTNVAAIGYDDSDGTLEVEFLNGYVYQYDGVSEQVYRDFLSCSSKGGFVHEHLKNRYRCRKL